MAKADFGLRVQRFRLRKLLNALLIGFGSPRVEVGIKNSARTLRPRRLRGELFFESNSPPRRRARGDYAEKTIFPIDFGREVLMRRDLRLLLKQHTTPDS